MKQIGLIFWKDVRNLWVELSVNVLLLAAYAIAAPQVWPGRSPNPLLPLFVTLLKVLMPASWLVVIARVVHADSLVGQEQFWITRPYRWTAMLGAKALFVAVCVMGPFAVMQWTLLLQAGLTPFTDVVGMALCLLRFVLNVALPFFILATVTDGLAPMFTAVAGILVAWAGLLTFLLSGDEMRMTPPYSYVLFCIVFGGLMTGILLYQYASRRTMRSWAAIAGTLVLFLVMIVGYDEQGFGRPVKALIRAHYAVSPAWDLKFVNAAPYDERGTDIQLSRKQVEVKLPLEIEGLSPEAKLHGVNVAVEIDGAGQHYAPDWQNAVMGEHTIGFAVPKDVFERVGNEEARVHLQLVAEELRPERVLNVMAAERFAGPMRGVCSLVKGKIYCRYAYREWTPARVQVSGCGGKMGAALRLVPAGANPDPVVSEELALRGKVCAGDAVQFTEFEVAREGRVESTSEAVTIGRYGVR